MFKIYEENKLIEETISGVLCAMYQAFRDNGCNIEDRVYVKLRWYMDFGFNLIIL